MKTAIFAIALMALSSTSYASEALDTCKHESAIAEVIMTARQNGKPMHLVMSINEKRFTGDILKRAQNMTTHVYKVQKYYYVSLQKKAIEDFSNEVFSQCYNQLTK